MLNKLNELGARGNILLNKGKEKIKNKFTRKKDGAKGILEENGLLIVAVVVCFIFRDVIIDVVQTIGTFATTKIKDLFTGI